MSESPEVSEYSDSSERPDTYVVDLIRDFNSGNNDNLPLPEPEEATLRSAVFTADTNRVRETLFELCNLSPSLARAAIRCLAPQPSSAESRQSALESILEAGASSIQPDSAASEPTAVPSTASPSRPPLSISSLVSPTDEAPAPSSGKKRRRSVDLAVCGYCREIFDENDIGGECRSHPGSLEPDWDNEYWADTDPEIHDTSPDDDSRHAQRWSCCDGDGWAKGCRVGPHKAKFNPKKYKRQ